MSIQTGIVTDDRFLKNNNTIIYIEKKNEYLDCINVLQINKLVGGHVKLIVSVPTWNYINSF